MNVTFVNSIHETFSPTAAGAAISIWVWEMCLAARRAGCEPLVVTRKRDAEPYDWKRTVFVPYPKISQNRLIALVNRAERKLTGWRHLRQRIYVRRVTECIKSAGMESGYIILHNEPEMAMYLQKLLPNAHLVLLFHNSNVLVQRAFKLSLGRFTGLILAVSDAAGRAIEIEYGLNPGIVKTLYNGVDIEQFRPRAQSNDEIPIINFTGRIRYEKAPDLLLRAAVALSKSTQGFSLQLLGRSELPAGQVDNYELEIRNLIVQLNSHGIVVREAGYVNRRHVAVEMRKAHIHVTPSRKQEEFGLVTVEAMASGLATVASQTGGTPELLGDAGLSFASEDVNELTRHLEVLVSDKELRTLYALRARARAERFTWNHTWAILVSFFLFK